MTSFFRDSFVKLNSQDFRKAHFAQVLRSNLRWGVAEPLCVRKSRHFRVLWSRASLINSMIVAIFEFSTFYAFFRVATPFFRLFREIKFAGILGRRTLHRYCEVISVELSRNHCAWKSHAILAIVRENHAILAIGREKVAILVIRCESCRSDHFARKSHAILEYIDRVSRWLISRSVHSPRFFCTRFASPECVVHQIQVG